MPVGRMVGRDAELVRIRTALDNTMAGVGECLIIEGSPGIGKSRLLAAAAEYATELGMATAPGRATKLDHVAPLSTLLGALRNSCPLVVDNFDQLGDPSSNRFWLIDQLGDRLERYVTERPLLITLDNVQWADELTALALRLLVPSLTSSPVLWLLACRTAPSRSPGRSAVELLLQEGVERIDLRPLDDAAVNALCREILGTEPDRDLLALARRSGGNPFLLEELLSGQRAGGGPLPAVDGLPGFGDRPIGADLSAGFVDAVQRHLQSLSQDAHRLLEAGAVLGRPFTVHEAAGLWGRRAVELVAAAEEAMQQDALMETGTELAFRHDLIRESVLSAIPGPVRKVLHREAVTVLRAENRPASEIAEHLIRGSSHWNSQTVDALRTTITQLARTSPSTAADLALRTLKAIGDDHPVRPRLAAEAVGLLSTVGRLSEAQELGEAALKTGMHPETEAMLLYGLASALKHGGQDVAAVRYTERALALPSVADPVRARVLAIQAHALLNAGGLRDAAVSADQAVLLARSAAEYPSMALGIAAQSIAAQSSGDISGAITLAGEAVQIADEYGGEAAQLHPRLWLGSAMAAADRFTEAAAVYEYGQREAHRFGTAWSQPLWHYHRAELWLARGLVDDAVAEAEAGLRMAEQLTTMAMGVPLLATLSRLALCSGDLETARARLECARRLDADGIGSRVEDLAWCTALLLEAEGRPEQALEALKPLLDGLPGRVLLFTQEPGAAPRVVRLALRTGARDIASVVADAISGLSRRNPGFVSLAAADTHTRGLLEGDPAMLRAAVEAYQDSPRTPLRAEALEDLGAAMQHTGHRHEATDLIREAYDLFTTAGLRMDADRVSERLGRPLVARTAAGPPQLASLAWSQLTRSEIKVARLVAEGLTNREVAARLFLSPHTVDSHLRHIFSKLGLSSRVALTRWVLKQDAAAEAEG
ncbi:AAA family ATPase [Streptomyces sp. NBC_01268]|uniref:helix-turn-helix transcriptional regulator n=2 Tax=Streptomyces TaxID=1883 RepID=UPI002E301635|nr:AAA family ATPase [Streptomyces sp. NBC_01268]